MTSMAENSTSSNNWLWTDGDGWEDCEPCISDWDWSQDGGWEDCEPCISDWDWSQDDDGWEDYESAPPAPPAPPAEKPSPAPPAEKPSPAPPAPPAPIMDDISEQWVYDNFYCNDSDIYNID